VLPDATRVNSQIDVVDNKTCNLSVPANHTIAGHRDSAELLTNGFQLVTVRLDNQRPSAYEAVFDFFKLSDSPSPCVESQVVTIREIISNYKHFLLLILLRCVYVIAQAKHTINVFFGYYLIYFLPLAQCIRRKGMSVIVIHIIFFQSLWMQVANTPAIQVGSMLPISFFLIPGFAAFITKVAPASLVISQSHSDIAFTATALFLDRCRHQSHPFLCFCLRLYLVRSRSTRLRKAPLPRSSAATGLRRTMSLCLTTIFIAVSPNVE
jgi:hypothetical protein